MVVTFEDAHVAHPTVLGSGRRVSLAHGTEPPTRLEDAGQHHVTRRRICRDRAHEAGDHADVEEQAEGDVQPKCTRAFFVNVRQNDDHLVHHDYVDQDDRNDKRDPVACNSRQHFTCMKISHACLDERKLVYVLDKVPSPIIHRGIVCSSQWLCRRIGTKNIPVIRLLPTQTSVPCENAGCSRLVLIDNSIPVIPITILDVIIIIDHIIKDKHK